MGFLYHYLLFLNENIVDKRSCANCLFHVERIALCVCVCLCVFVCLHVQVCVPVVENHQRLGSLGAMATDAEETGGDARSISCLTKCCPRWFLSDGNSVV